MQDVVLEHQDPPRARRHAHVVLGAGVGEEGGVAPRHALVQVQLHRHEALLAAVRPPVAPVEVWFEVLARGVLQEAEPLVETHHLVVVPGGGDELLD